MKDEDQDGIPDELDSEGQEESQTATEMLLELADMLEATVALGADGICPEAMSEFVKAIINKHESEVAEVLVELTSKEGGA